MEATTTLNISIHSVRALKSLLKCILNRKVFLRTKMPMWQTKICPRIKISNPTSKERKTNGSRAWWKRRKVAKSVDLYFVDVMAGSSSLVMSNDIKLFCLCLDEIYKYKSNMQFCFNIYHFVSTLKFSFQNVSIRS